jgi:hypothetical protein
MRYLVAPLLLISVAAFAQEEPVDELPPVAASSIAITSSFEDGGGRTNSLFGRYNFKNGIGVSASVGSSHIVGDRETKTSEQASVGLESDSRRLFSAGITLDYWGLEETFTTTSQRLPIYLNLKNWIFNITPGAGQVTVTGRFGNRTIEREDQIIGSSVTFLGLENWSFRIAHEKHDYNFNDANLALVANNASLFSETTMAMSSSLINSRSSAEAVYSFAKIDLGLEVSTVEVTIDESKQRSSTLLLDYFHNKNWVFSATAGSSKVIDNGRSTTDLEALDPNRYGSIGAKYRFK